MTMVPKMTFLVGTALLTVAGLAVERTSDETFVYLQPETSSFWRTATNSTVTLTIDFPAGATTATLDVRGLKHERSYPNITGKSFDLHLPTPESPETENVYDLTLTFDDGTVRKASLGVVQGISNGTEGAARCLAPFEGATWNRMRGSAVLPIPYGTTAFSVAVNGVARTVEGLDGAQGWYALGGVRRDDSVSLALDVDGASHVATLRGRGDGGIVINLK